MSEEIIDQIIRLCPGVSKDQVLERLDQEKCKTGGLIGDEALLRMIAAGFGCASSVSRLETPSLVIRDLVPGLYDVTVIGRVVATFRLKCFSGGKAGKLASVFVADKSGLVRVVLWDDKADLVESGVLGVGRIVRFAHGYTREVSGGKVEVHVGDKGVVEIGSEGLRARDYPGILRFSSKIVDVASGVAGRRINVVGSVARVFPVSVFDRDDGSKGRVLRFLIWDGSGEVSIVVWDERADELSGSLGEGDLVQVVNGRAKKGLGDGFEVNVDGFSYVGPFALGDEVLRVNDLRGYLEVVNVEGEVVSAPVVREVRVRDGGDLALATFELGDEAGRVVVSAWGVHADVVSLLCVGDRVVISNALVKKASGGGYELSTGDDTVFEKA